MARRRFGIPAFQLMQLLGGAWCVTPCCLRGFIRGDDGEVIAVSVSATEADHLEWVAPPEDVLISEAAAHVEAVRRNLTRQAVASAAGAAA